MDNQNIDPALTDGASASLPRQPPKTEYQLSYIVIKNTGVKRFDNEELGATHDIVAGTVYQSDKSAHEAARRIMATEGPIVVRVPPGFKVVRAEEEFRASKHLRAIRALITGKNEPWQLEEDMIAVVEVCSRVFHAYRMLRETALKNAITEALHKASTEELLSFARALDVLPDEFKDNPFEEPPDREPKQPARARQEIPEAGTRGGNEELGRRRA